MVNLLSMSFSVSLPSSILHFTLQTKKVILTTDIINIPARNPPGLHKPHYIHVSLFLVPFCHYIHDPYLFCSYSFFNLANSSSLIGGIGMSANSSLLNMFHVYM